MRQARWTTDSIELVDVEPPPLAADWVRLSVSACGICGTDLHLLRREVPVAPGGVPGHEISGVPLDGPKGLAEALYAVEPRLWCGTCELCGGGHRHLCPKGQLFGITRPGGLADFVDVPRAALHRVDASVTPLAASVSEPLAVCVRALRLAEPQEDSRVLILGGGSIGLLCGLLARDRAHAVAITARHPHQREAARSLGLVPLAEDEVAAWSSDAGPDVVIETVGGRSETLEQALLCCRPAGRIVVLGVFAHEPRVNAFALMAKELTLLGSNTYGFGHRGSDFGAAVELLPRYVTEIAGMQTHQFGLEKLEDAFACAEDKSSGAIKVTLLPGGTV